MSGNSTNQQLRQQTHTADGPAPSQHKRQHPQHHQLGSSSTLQQQQMQMLLRSGRKTSSDNCNGRQRSRSQSQVRRLSSDLDMSGDQQSVVYDYNFDNHNMQPLYRRTPYNQRTTSTTAGAVRSNKFFDDASWQETSLRLQLPEYAKALSPNDVNVEDMSSNENSVMDSEKPGPVNFNPKNAKLASSSDKGKFFSYPDAAESQLFEPHIPLDYEQFDSSVRVDEDDNNGMRTPPRAPPSSPRRSASTPGMMRRQQPQQPDVTPKSMPPPQQQQLQQQKAYTGINKAPLSLIAKQFGRSTSGPFYPGCFEQQVFEHRQRNPTLYHVYPNSPAPIPSDIAAIASPVWSGDRTGDTIGWKSDLVRLAAKTRTAKEPESSSEASAAATESEQQHQPQPQQQKKKKTTMNEGRQRLELIGSLETVLLNGQIIWTRAKKNTNNNMMMTK